MKRYEGCGNYRSIGMTRREVLANVSLGFGSLAASVLMPKKVLKGHSDETESNSDIPHHAPKVKRIIFLYMDGGPSQVDTFDPKPRSSFKTSLAS